MLNSIQHPIKSRTYEILKQVQDDKPGLFTRPSNITTLNSNLVDRVEPYPELPLTNYIYELLYIRTRKDYILFEVV